MAASLVSSAAMAVRASLAALVSVRPAAISRRRVSLRRQAHGRIQEYAGLANAKPLTITATQALLRDDEALILFLDVPQFWKLTEESLIWVLCHEQRRSKRRCVTVLEMKVGPSGSAIRSLIPSHRKLLWSKSMVVSVAEKSGR
jgi:hypothetical protein